MRLPCPHPASCRELGSGRWGGCCFLITSDKTHSALQSAPSPGGAQGPGREGARPASRSSGFLGDPRWGPEAKGTAAQGPPGFACTPLCARGRGAAAKPGPGGAVILGGAGAGEEGVPARVPLTGMRTHEVVPVGDLPLSSFLASSFSPWLHPSLAPSIPFLERGAPCARTRIAQEIEELAVGGKGCHCCIWRWRLDRGPAGQPPSALWISAPLWAPRPMDGWWFPALLERQTKFFLCCLRLFLSL